MHFFLGYVRVGLRNMGDQKASPCVQSKCNWRTYASLSPLGDVSTTSAPEPSSYLDPSKCIVQYLAQGVFGEDVKSVQSLTKSTKA